MSRRGDGFVRKWVIDNVQNIPGLENYTNHVAELAQQLIADAATQGIQGSELNETLGDVEGYLASAYEHVQDGTLGFHESDKV